MAEIYSFAGHARWSWPWTSPTCLGASVALVMPFVWAAAQLLCRRRWALGLLFAAESGLYVILCRTYSRGSLLATAAAGMLFVGSVLWTHRMEGIGRRRPICLAIAARVALLSFLIWMTGFASRATPGYMASDRSFLHRASLWTGGLRMIAASPWVGWGRHEGALQYMHWYQPLSDHTSHGNLVNGNLTLAVEFGLPVFIAVAAAIAACLAAPFVLVRRDKVRPGSRKLALVQGCAAAATGYIVGNTFSTLTEKSALLAAVALGCLVMCGLAYRQIGWASRSRIAVGSIMSATAVGLICWGFGRYLEANATVRVERIGPTVIGLSPAGASTSDQKIRVIPDPEVLGDVFGRTLRQWLEASDRGLCIVVDTSPAPMAVGGERVVLFGRAVAYVGRFASAHLVLVHPTLLGPLPPLAADLVVLPEFDMSMQRSAWEGCRERGVPFKYSPAVGQDIRPAWPTIAGWLINHDLD